MKEPPAMPVALLVTAACSALLSACRADPAGAALHPGAPVALAHAGRAEGGVSGSDSKARAERAPAPVAPPTAPPADAGRTTIAPQACANYAAGVVLALQNRWGEALKRFQRARELDPASPRILLKIGECLEQSGRHEEALSAYRRAARLGGKNFAVQMALSGALERRGRHAQALQALETALQAPDADEASADYVLALWRLAGLAQRLDRNGQALAHYRRLLGLLSRPRRGYRARREVWALVRHREFVLEELGKLYLGQGRAKEAVRCLEEARTLAPGSSGIRYRLAEAYLAAGRNDDALAEAEALLDRLGSDAAVLDLYVRSAEAAGKPGRAVARLEALLKKRPGDPALRFFLARCYRLVGRLEQAGQLLRSVLENQPASGMVSAELSAVLRKKGRPAQAMDLIARALDRGAGGPSLLREVERVTDALKADTEARRTWRERAEKRPGSLGTRFLVGHLLLAMGSLEEADRVLADLVHNNPSFLWGVADLVEVRIRLRRYPEALAVCRRAMKRGLSREPIIHRTMAALYLRLDRAEEALKAVERALELAPGDARSLYLKGSVLERMKRDREAERVFREILARDPGHADAANALSYLLATRNRDLAEARRLVERALRREPDNGAFLDTLGWVLYRQGKYQEALRALERAAENIRRVLPGGDPVILDHLGDVYLRLGDTDQARRAWKEALELNQKDPNPELDPAVLRKKMEALPD